MHSAHAYAVTVLGSGRSPKTLGLQRFMACNSATAIEGRNCSSDETIGVGGGNPAGRLRAVCDPRAQLQLHASPRRF